MRSFDINQAKTHLSRLVDEAARGMPFTIAKAGKPMVKVVRLEEATADGVQRMGFMRGQITVPKDFDRMGQKEIAGLFGRADD